MRHALITANVFQNCLSKQDACWTYYTDLLRRLSNEPIQWYMTEWDYDLAVKFWNIFRLRMDDACQRVYYHLLQQVKSCPIAHDILEVAEDYSQINFCDALRLACAVDHNLETIATWEPHQFAQTFQEHNEVQTHRFFHKNIPTTCAETGDTLYLRVGVFAVDVFLLNLNRLHRLQTFRRHQSQCFSLESFNLRSGDRTVVSVRLCEAGGQLLQSTAEGSTPMVALQRAIDAAVDQSCRSFQLPPRQIVRFFIPPGIIAGADASVEVVIGVECGGSSFESSASNPNLFRAAAEAYVEVINRICRHPNLPDTA